MKNDLEDKTGVPAPISSRREFIRAAATGGAGVLAAGLVPSIAQASRYSAKEPKHMEKPIEVVRRFCAAWSNDAGVGELAAFFTDDAVYHNIPMAPVIGRENIAKNIASFIRPGAPGIVGIKFNLINIAANGPVVMTERVDAFRTPDKSFELPVMGTFEVRDGKIKAWRDYFDLNQFTTRMG
jgi:limonene-1,2-epoxide hydrolase